MRVLALAVLLALPAAGGCVQHPSQAIDDATLMVQVKTALLNDPTIGAMRIEVDVEQAVVELSGQVPSERDVERAVALARRVSGVREVKSALQIAPAGGRTVT